MSENRGPEERFRALVNNFLDEADNINIATKWTASGEPAWWLKMMDAVRVLTSDVYPRPEAGAPKDWTVPHA